MYPKQHKVGGLPGVVARHGKGGFQEIQRSCGWWKIQVVQLKKARVGNSSKNSGSESQEQYGRDERIRKHSRGSFSFFL